ncbi:hypothetical protein Tco_0141306 [Tanacetum coccineum]
MESPCIHFLEYLAPSNIEVPVEDQPHVAHALPTSLSLGYIADSDPEEDPEEEEHLALANSIVVPPAVDLVPSAEETKPFKTDESVATPPPPPPTYRTIGRVSIRAQAHIPFPSEAEVARLLTIPTPPLSPITPLSSPLPQIPSLPVPVHHLLLAQLTLRRLWVSGKPGSS